MSPSRVKLIEDDITTSSTADGTAATTAVEQPKQEKEQVCEKSQQKETSVLQNETQTTEETKDRYRDVDRDLDPDLDRDVDDANVVALIPQDAAAAAAAGERRDFKRAKTDCPSAASNAMDAFNEPTSSCARDVPSIRCDEIMQGAFGMGARHAHATVRGRGLGPPPSSSSSSSSSSSLSLFGSSSFRGGGHVGRKRADDRLGSLSWQPHPQSQSQSHPPSTVAAAVDACDAPSRLENAVSAAAADPKHIQMALAFTPAVLRKVESDRKATTCPPNVDNGHVGERQQSITNNRDSMAITAKAKGSAHVAMKQTSAAPGPAASLALPALKRTFDQSERKTAKLPAGMSSTVTTVAAQSAHNNDDNHNNKLDNTPPKQALNNHYLHNNLLSQQQLHNMKSYYTVWDNANEQYKKSHLKKFTCIFTCPVTGEHFPCGRYAVDERNERICEENGFFWYQNTKMAMDAAASKALDCFLYRYNVDRNIAGNSKNYRCRDAPYLANMGPSLRSLPLGLVLPRPLVTTNVSAAAAAAATASTGTTINLAEIGRDTSVDAPVSQKNDNLGGAINKSTEADRVKPPSVSNTDNNPRNTLQNNRNEITPSNIHNTPPPMGTIQRQKNNSQNIKRPPPKQELNELYTAMGLDSSKVAEIRNYYATWYDAHNNPKSHEKKYTCVFTCPLTGERFACGYWENEGGIVSEGTVFWYQNSKLAMNAAAAKALDCFAFRECHGTKDLPMLRCHDEPYLKGKAPPLPEPPNGITLINSLLHIEEKCSKHGNDQSNTTSEPLEAITAKNTADSPKGTLHKWYTDYWRRVSKSLFVASHSSLTSRVPDKNSFTTWSNLKFNAAERRFTSVFTCPWTGERFLSGKLIGDGHEYFEEDFLFENGHQGVMKRLVWYRSKKEAENAAAGRCLDCLRLRNSGRKGQADPTLRQFCVEPPYDSEEGSMNWLKLITGLDDLIWLGKDSSVEIRKTWAIVDDRDRVPIRFECISTNGD